MKLKKKASRLAGKAMRSVIDSFMGSGLMQEETAAQGERYVTPGIGPLIRQAGAESCVLLKNDGALPLEKGRPVAVFGRCQLDWFYVGYGSGGDVHAPYYAGLIEGLRAAGAEPVPELLDAYMAWTREKEHAADHGWWGHWPTHHPEMPLDPDLVRRAAQAAPAALVVIGRAAGEDRENTLTQGSYYLTDGERAMLDAVTAAFERVVVVMNIGSVMDMAWTRAYGDRLSALLIVWLGGMESGNAAADVLTGAVSPCGRLADTIARRYEDHPTARHFGGKAFNDYAEGIYVGYRYFDRHPDKVLYPFGFGLSYTSFAIRDGSVRRAGMPGDAEGDGGDTAGNAGDAARKPEKRNTASFTVTNTGAAAGKLAVPLWCRPPEGRIGKPVRVLAAFGKTRELQPGESERIELAWDDTCMASFDEAEHGFVLERGTYRLLADDTEIGSLTVGEETVVEVCEPLCRSSRALRTRILERLPREIGPEGAGQTAGAVSEKDPGVTVPGGRQAAGPEIRFEDVCAGRASLEDFIAGLSDDDLEALTRGHGMMGSPLGVPGNAGVFGGVTESLREKGVPVITAADGPAGLRLRRYCALLPCGTALACTWNTGLVEQLYRKVGEEMIRYGVDVLLAPGMNLHRDPLCGRNFEYYSEDPLLSGKMAAAAVRGVQGTGRAACPKHFACNNQETKRSVNDSRVSERALREIYLRGFEIAVKEGRPLVLMTSYNKVNGVWSHYNYDLVTTVLRGEWGFDGCVITDWWMRRSRSPEFPRLADNAYRVRAQVDVLMPGDMGHTARAYKADKSLRRTIGEPDGITRAELQRSAKNVLSLAIRIFPT